MHTLALLLSLTTVGTISPQSVPDRKHDAAIEAALARAGENGAQIARVLEEAPDSEKPGILWLLKHMPEGDLQTLESDFLLENAHHAYAAWREAPWHEQVSEEIFLDAILPYASVNERRDRWRPDFRERFSPLVADASTASEAAAILNNAVFSMVGVKYSTQRPKPDQSPYESMDAGMASCTGLSVLLIDACRSVGVPARFVGTALWSDESGNHSWVEVWDDGWHFTGAAEPSGNDLNKAWFAGRASKATREDPRKAIYAVTWRDTPINFPMVWRPNDTSVNAVDVTDRYTRTKEALPDGMARVRFRVMNAEGQRIGMPVKISSEDDASQVMFSGTSKDERFDANDHLEAILPIGAELTFTSGSNEQSFTVEDDEQLETLLIPAPVESRSNPVTDLRRWLSRGAPGEIEEQPFANRPLTRKEAEQARKLLWNAHKRRIKKERASEMKASIIALDGVDMPFWYTTYGKKPRHGRSLWISMHGGGGGPARMNTQQWENQKQLYQPDEGIYLAPRAPTNTWNLWHQGHIDPLLDRLIENMIVHEDVNPDKVYILGYSAGGDGVYQLAPRMADRWAAAAMMAGHPNDARPDSLRNTAFTLHMGENDTPYNRNKVAAEWKSRLAELNEHDPDGYDHWVEIHEGKGHWMDGEDAAALPWMADRTRNARPVHVVWRQDDVTHPRFYWLAVDEPTAGRTITATARTLESGSTIDLGADSGQVRIRLDDTMFDLDEQVRVTREGEVLHQGTAPRTIAILHRTLEERGDPNGMFCAEIVVE